MRGRGQGAKQADQRRLRLPDDPARLTLRRPIVALALCLGALACSSPHGQIAPHGQRALGPGDDALRALDGGYHDAPTQEPPASTSEASHDAGLVGDPPAASVDAAPMPTRGSDAGVFDGAAPAGEVSGSASSVEVRLEREPVLRRGERARPKGRVAAGGADEELGRWNLGGNGDPTYPSNRAGFHPGTRVVVDARVLSGTLPESAAVDRRTGKHVRVLSRVALLAESRKNGYWPFRLCFEAGARATPTLHGTTRVRFRVARDARPREVTLVDTRLADASVARCLVDRVAELRYWAPPNKPITAELAIQLYPGDVPLPSLDPAPEGPAPDLRDVTAVLDASASEIGDCFRNGRRRDPALWGRLELALTLDGHARATRVAERDSRFPDAEVRRCVEHGLRRADWPKVSVELLIAWRLLPGK